MTSRYLSAYDSPTAIVATRVSWNRDAPAVQHFCSSRLQSRRRYACSMPTLSARCEQSARTWDAYELRRDDTTNLQLCRGAELRRCPPVDEFLVHGH